MKNICRIIIASVFIISSVGKIVNIAAFQWLIIQYGLGFFQCFAPLIVLLELLIGLLLILEIRTKEISILSFFTLLLFTIAFTYGYLINDITDCGCFGQIKILQDNIFFVYARNIILMGMSVFLWIASPKENTSIFKWKKILLTSILLPAIFFSGMTFRPAMFYTKKHEYLNKSLKETPLQRYLTPQTNSKYLLFYFSYSCPHCWNSIENYKQYFNSSVVDSAIAYVLIDSNKTANDSIKNVFHDHFKDLIISEIDQDSVTFINVLPTSFYVEHDTIKAVIETTLPSPYVFDDFVLKNE